MSRQISLTCLAALALSSCAGPERATTYDEQLDKFVEEVSKAKMGRDVDHWIELKNLAGEWEQVGLIFGYIGDYDECQKAIEGLKKVNYAREYRCVPAQRAAKP